MLTHNKFNFSFIINLVPAAFILNMSDLVINFCFKYKEYLISIQSHFFYGLN